MNGYFVVRENGLICNAVAWDGQTEFTIDGCTLIPIPDGCPAWIGWSLVDGSFVPPDEVAS